MQLNFLTGYELSEENVKKDQFELWDDNFRPTKRKDLRLPSYKKIEDYFASLDYSKVEDYTKYWEKISPKNDSEVFQRWLFAFMSVHTSWKSNIVGYLAIKDWWKWLNRWGDLADLIQNSRVGMHNNRVKYISEFCERFWEDPSYYSKAEDESWTEYRNRLERLTLGLGLAKTSFAIEMCYPVTAKVVCMDTHMFKYYGLDQTADARQYLSIEQHWTDMCAMWNIPSYVARCLYWDVKQGHTDSRYWSYVLE
jgi:hypothetical protein